MASVNYIFILLIHYFVRVMYWLTAPIFRWLYEGSHRGLPAVDDPLLMKSAVELSRLIRSREVSSERLVRACIARIQAVNPYVNAVVADRYDAAIAEAKQVDAVLNSSDPLPDKYSEASAPFLGVPLTTKEAISVKGLPNTSGLLARRRVVSAEDADAIAILRRAGAIPLAVTNVSELCMWYESDNLLYGRCTNAYHQGRMVGGSSGGEGCLQSTGASPMGIGADIGGSIRMPAFFNGVFGHKCSTGVVSNAGQHPNAKAGAQEFLSTGPLCRFASDLMPMFRLLVREDKRAQLRLDDKVDVRRLRVFYMEDDGGGLLVSPVHPQIKEAVRNAADHFRSLGCVVKKADLPQLKHSFQIWSTMMSNSGDDTFCQLMADGAASPINPFKELALLLTGRKRHTLPAIGLGIGEKFGKTQEAIAAIRQRRDDLRRDLCALLGDDAIFLYPTHPLPAPYHRQPLVVLFNFSYTGIFNTLGVPVTAVPMGLARGEGVPIGIQVVGARNSDRLCIAAAEELERKFGGWVPPFEFKPKA